MKHAVTTTYRVPRDNGPAYTIAAGLMPTEVV